MKKKFNIDGYSETWQEISTWANIRLDSARKSLEKSLDIDQTNVLRGKIRILKELILLAVSDE